MGLNLRRLFSRRAEFDATQPRRTVRVQDVASLLTPGAGSISRREALTVPAVQKGRNQLAAIATLPLVQIGPLGQPVDNPLLRQFDPDVPNVVHIAQTVEDLLFDAIAWWEVIATDFNGFPVSVRRRDPASVTLDPPNTTRMPSPLPSGIDPRGASVWVDGREVPANLMLRFDSPNPSILDYCGRTIRRAIALEQAAAMYADDPRPLDLLVPADGAEPIDDDEVPAILAMWKAARKARSTAYLPASLKYVPVDAPSPQELQLVELQRQAWVELSQALGIDAEDLGVSTTSRTYQNDVDRRMAKINDVLSPYMRAISDRLSMGDATRRGHRIEFDLTGYLRPDPAGRIAYYQGLSGLGVITPEQIARAEGLPAPADNTPQEAPVGDASTASSDAQHTFSGPGLTFADVELTEFSVDTEARTITGLALPYGKYANKGGLKFRFDKGSLQWTDPSRVKLNTHHDTRQTVGYAEEIKDTGAGYRLRFKVARGPAGDEALQLAQDKVLDGMSVGVDFDASTDAVPDPRDRSALLVRRADLKHVALTPEPAFDDARVTRVTASASTEGIQMTESNEPEAQAQETPAEAPVAQTFSAEQVAAMLAAVRVAPADAPAVVNPVRPVASTSVREALPYRFDRGGQFTVADHEFSTDIVGMLKRGDYDGRGTEEGRRVMGLISARFAADPTVSTDVDELNPTISRPDMYVGLRPYTTPIWNVVNKGGLPNGIQPFAFPKRASSTIAVSKQTEGTEPEGKGIVTTSQTVTPEAFAGKASLTRQVFDMGGNPAVSNLIWQEFTASWFKGLETAAGAFLNTLTAATDLVTITAGDKGTTLTNEIEAGLSALAFVDGYSFEVAFVEQYLYAELTAATGTDGRKVYPIIAPQNANGQATSRFGRIDVAGVPFVPAAGLGAGTAGAANNSWLIDPSTVHGWASAPQRLEFAGTDASGNYAPVAMVDIALWGYQAFANTDIGGLRQISYDNAE